MTDPNELNPLTLFIRGTLGKCPKCGQSHLFQGYLKQVEECAVCGEAWGDIRADDGPTWLTLFVVLHLIAPALIVAARYDEIPYALLIIGVSVAAVLLTLIVLPLAKGLFIAILWKSKAGQGKKAE